MQPFGSRRDGEEADYLLQGASAVLKLAEMSR